jgi:hypothetical protein
MTLFLLNRLATLAATLLATATSLPAALQAAPRASCEFIGTASTDEVGSRPRMLGAAARPRKSARTGRSGADPFQPSGRGGCPPAVVERHG